MHLGKLFIILCDTPFQSERVEQVLKLAETAIEKGHEVSFFLFMDGVYNMLTTQKGEHFQVTPVSKRLKDLISRGAKITCCKLCMELRGLEKSMIPEGIMPTGVSEINDEISEADAVLSFTGET